MGYVRNVTIFNVSHIYLCTMTSTMSWEQYLSRFDEILSGAEQEAPYNDPHFLEYTRLNRQRMNRWLNTAVLSEDTKKALEQIGQEQHWVLITEPWCGDAAHSVPIIALMALHNPKIRLDIQLRDSGSEIEQYLTNGGKAVPVLIIRNTEGKDLGVWGPRPGACQQVFLQMKREGLSLEEQKVKLQQWYNADKALSIQQEIVALIHTSVPEAV